MFNDVNLSNPAHVVIFIAMTLLTLSACSNGGGEGGGASVSVPLPVNASTEVVVQANGNKQTDDSGWLQHHAIVGESIVGGTFAAISAISLRHGFMPPSENLLPSAIAASSLSNLQGQ